MKGGTFSMFKCPVHQSFTELHQPCETCGQTIEYYESNGHSFEAMICDMTEQQRYKAITQREFVLKRQKKQLKIEEEKRKAEQNLLLEANELKRKEEAEQSRKELICGVCGSAKESRDQKVCSSCFIKANQLRASFEQKICFNCKLRPALKEQTGSMCRQCTDEYKRKYFCPVCRAQKAENQDKCDECEKKQQQKTDKKISVVCTICKINPQFEKQNVCRDCIAKKRKPICKSCNVKEAQVGSDYCAHCELRVSQQRKQTVCKNCGTDIYTTEGILCHLCQNLCSCGEHQIANGEKRCFVCLDQLAAEQKMQRPQTARIETSQSQILKTIKCPKCMKNMLLKDVPSGGPLKVLQCRDCGRGSSIRDIMSHNNITSLTEGVFSYQDPKIQKSQNKPWDCLKCQNVNTYYATQCNKCSIKKTDHDRIYSSAPQQPQNKEESKYQQASNCAKCGKQKESISLSACIECMSKIEVPKKEKEKCVQCHKEERFKHYENCIPCRSKNLQKGELDEQREKQVKQNELLVKQREEEEIKARQMQCPNCQLSKENPSDAYCDDCTCRQCKKDVIYKKYDHCYACLVLRQKAKEQRLQKEQLERLAVEQEKERLLKESQAAIAPGYSLNREAPLPRTGPSEYQSRYTFNQVAKGSSAQNRSRSSDLVSIGNQVPIVKPTFKRSLLVQEFGIENNHGHLNCFLNVCLQALWQFPKVRADLQFMIDNRDAAGSEQIKPFINSLQDFYKQIITVNSRQSTGDVPVVKSNNVRAELFKLNYSRNEFSLHEKADAFEALDQILTIIHLWQKSIEAKDGAKKQLPDAAKLFCYEGEPCFVHQSFGQSSVSQELCTCNKLSAVRNQDPNVFAYSINVPDVLSLFARFKLPREEEEETNFRNFDEETKRVFVTNQKLVTALKHMQTKEREGCAEDPTLKGHQTKTISCVETNPEVFIFNATWGENPTPSQIFKFMISLPEIFISNEIYDDNPEDTYILRGFFAFQGAHYISFFRRVYMKLDYLPVSDYQKIAEIHKMMEAEVTSRTEWTIFDDSVIDHRGGWQDVVKQCVDIRMYPTVIFYEKLDPDENPPAPLDTSEADDRKILEGFRKSKEADYNWGVSSGFGVEYDENQIAEQIELMNEFKKQNAKENGGEDVKSTSIRVEKEETKVSQPKIAQPTSTKPLTLPELKKKYQEYGIYLFQCNKCEDGIFALHSKNCLKPGCGSENHFVQQNVCTDLGKWSECFRAIFILRNWKIEPLQKPPSQPAPGLNLSDQRLIAGENRTEKEESKVSNQTKHPLQHFSNKISLSQLLNRAPVQNLTNPEQEKHNLTLQGHLNQKRDQDTQDLNLDQKTAQVEQTQDDQNARKTYTKEEVRNEEAKAIDLSFFRQTAPQVPQEESMFSYLKLDDYVSPGNPALLLKPDFANIGSPFAHQFQQSQQEIQHHQDQRVNQSLTHQNISYGQDDRLAGSTQEETKGDTDQRSQRDTKNKTNQAAKQKSFERLEDKKRSKGKNRAGSSSDEANFEDELEGKKLEFPTAGNLIKPGPALIDLKPRQSDFETISMFKCPKHGTFTELQQSCETCGRTIEDYISAGYQIETMLFDMTQPQFYQLIQENERKNSKPEKKDYLNTSQPGIGSSSHRQVFDNTQEKSQPYWKCWSCRYTNDMTNKICTGCGRADTFKDSQHTDIPQPVQKPILSEVVAKDPKIQKYRNEGWNCLKCSREMPYYTDSCYNCRIKKTDNDRIYVDVPQQPPNQEDKKYYKASNCAECGKPKESVSLSACIECLSKCREFGIKKDDITTCLSCKTQKRHEQLDFCFKCYIKNREIQELGLSPQEVGKREQLYQQQFKERLIKNKQAKEQSNKIKL